MTLKETLGAICDLQPRYSSENTPDMQRRGELVRRTLANHVRAMGPSLRQALREFGSDFDVDASDGIGRKTEAPWVRLFSRQMAPNPRTGFYAVIHFAADGSAAYITVGCGATTWADGELRPLPDTEIDAKTLWARQVVAARFGSLDPFNDTIVLGARASLPRAFERATALARRVVPAASTDAEIETLIRAAAERLLAIYEQQRVGGDLSAGELTAVELERVLRPGRGARGQGFRLSAQERIAIERQAMAAARTWLERQNYTVVDTSANSPFDFLASRGTEQLKVEVKGTTASVVDSLFMTRNEVELHRSEKGSTALIMVSGIALATVNAAPVASGGTITPLISWNIDEWEITPMAFQLRRKPAVQSLP